MHQSVVSVQQSQVRSQRRENERPLLIFVLQADERPLLDHQSKKAVIVSNDRYKEAREGGNLKGSDLLRAGGKSPKGEFRQRWNKEKA